MITSVISKEIEDKLLDHPEVLLFVTFTVLKINPDLCADQVLGREFSTVMLLSGTQMMRSLLELIMDGSAYLAVSCQDIPFNNVL